MVCNFIINRLQNRCFPVKFVKFSKNTFFCRIPPVAASEIKKKNIYSAFCYDQLFVWNMWLCKSSKFHSLQMKIEKKAFASEMCHSCHWNSRNGDPPLNCKITLEMLNVYYLDKIPHAVIFCIHFKEKTLIFLVWWLFMG